MTSDLAEITGYLHAHIPLTRALGVQVVAWDQTTIRITAPLAPNLNHRETAFGGSVASLGILAGWTLVFLRLKSRGFAGRIVIQKCVADFLEPIPGDFEALCSAPPPDEWNRFVTMLERKGKGRVRVRSDIRFGGSVVAVEEGTFVALQTSQTDATPAGSATAITNRRTCP